MAGQPLGYITSYFIILSLFLAGVIQLVSSASNVYYANDHLNKRQWKFAGAISILSIFLPISATFEESHAIPRISFTTTTAAYLYLIIAAFSHGQRGNITHTGSNSNQQFFTGMTNAIFVWGGHGITMY
ncbi:unnamed protein product [Calypogeia fissa]